MREAEEGDTTAVKVTGDPNTAGLAELVSVTLLDSALRIAGSKTSRGTIALGHIKNSSSLPKLLASEESGNNFPPITAYSCSYLS